MPAFNRISVEIDGDSRGLTRATQQADRSLGRLDSSVSDTNTSLRGLETSFAAVGIAATAAAAAMTAAGIAAINNAKEIRNLSDAASISAEELQLWSIAASTVGFEMRDVSDALRDVNDRAGELISEGSGEMLGLFEALGISVDEAAKMIKGMSSTDTLQLLVSLMEEAGFNAQQMTAGMEMITSNSTFLLPLLQDNAKALNELSEEAIAFNRVLSQTEIDALADAADQIDKFGQTFLVLSARMTEKVLPAINAVNKAISHLLFDLFKTDAQEAFGDALRENEDTLNGFNAAIESYQDAIAASSLTADEFISVLKSGNTELIATLETAIKFGDKLKDNGELTKDQADAFDSLTEALLATDMAARDGGAALDMIANSISDRDLALVFSTSAGAINDQSVALVNLARETEVWAALSDVQREKVDDLAKAFNVVTVEVNKGSEAIKANTDEQKSWLENAMAMRDSFSGAVEQDTLFNQLYGADSFGAEAQRLLDEQARFEQRMADQKKAAMDGLLGLTKSGFSKLFEESKAAKTAIAIIDGYQAYQSAVAWGTQLGGPVGGAIAGAASAGVTLATIAKMNSTNLGSTSFDSGGGASGASASQVADAGAAPSTTNITRVTIVGDAISRDQMSEFLNGLSRDGQQFELN
jgi:hypothetical protein